MRRAWSHCTSASIPMPRVDAALAVGYLLNVPANLDPEFRSRGVGASEIYAAMRRHKSLWDLKTGRREPFTGNIYTDTGRALERVILDHTGAKHGLTLEDTDSQVHPEHDFLFASPDAIGVTALGGRCVVEVKAPQTERSRAKWGESSEGWWGIPCQYRTQVVSQMACLGLDRAVVGAHLGESQIRTFEVWRDLAWEDEMIERVGEFWQFVVNDEPPSKLVLPKGHDFWWAR